MNIAFIGQKGIPTTFGGVEFHVEQLSRKLVAQNHRAIVYVRDWYTDKSLIDFEGVSLIHLPTIHTKHLDAFIHSFLCSIHASFSNAHIIHYHGIGPAIFSLFPWLFGKKVIVTVHRLDWATEKWGYFAKACLILGEYISAKIPDATIVVSEDLQKYFKTKYGRETIYIPNGTAPSYPTSVNFIRDKYQLEKHSYILFMGRLSPEKRVDWLIKAYQELTEQEPELSQVKLVIAGASSATDQYVQQLLKLSNNHIGIIFTGYVIGIEKEELLSNALFFVLPSYLEGYPIVLLEAMSYCLCSLASNIAPNQDIIRHEDNGILFDTNSFPDFTNKLKTLLKAPELTRAIGMSAKEEIGRRPTWHQVEQQTEELYYKILKEHN
jgi:glycosyltransferase involved in cell wall biosynthesis